MKEWTRHIPHPNYGYWCGAKNTHPEWHDRNPVDYGDAACRIHDFALRDADRLDVPACRIAARKRADASLHRSWKRFRPRRLYAKLYRRILLLLFK